jgi:sirohydrochlorin ferrochelatase
MIVAHGSRHGVSNQEIKTLASRMRSASSDVAVACAFLEFESPTVSEAMTELVGQGVSEVAVFPYFLAEGTHVACDLPALLQAERVRFPGLVIRQLPHVGQDPDFLAWLVAKVKA